MVTNFPNHSPTDGSFRSSELPTAITTPKVMTRAAPTITVSISLGCRARRWPSMPTRCSTATAGLGRTMRPVRRTFLRVLPPGPPVHPSALLKFYIQMKAPEAQDTRGE